MNTSPLRIKQFKLLSVSLLLAIVMKPTTSSTSSLRRRRMEEEQCYGLDPQPSVANFLGMTLDYELADRICCHNHHYAEPKGYLTWKPDVDLFSRLDPSSNTTTFYDSVCGIPLFIAPRGRTFDEFMEESIHHGWPSFRPEEMISENVIIHDDGRMESKCLTHLGHNLPTTNEDGVLVDRYCIDLVCIAGEPVSTTISSSSSSETVNTEEEVVIDDVDGDNADETLLVSTAKNESSVVSSNTEDNQSDVEEVLLSVIEQDKSGIITADEFDEETYVSSAEQSSGKYNDVGRKVMISVVTIVVIILVGGIAAFFYLKQNKETNKKLDANGQHLKITSPREGGDAPGFKTESEATVNVH